MRFILYFILIVSALSCDKKILEPIVNEEPCEQQTEEPNEEPNEIEDSVVYYLALGDSYTIGQSVSPDSSWPKQLDAKLFTEGSNIITKIIAQTGWRTDNLINAANAELTDEMYDIVSLLIGVNNEYQGQDPAGFEPKFRDCLDLAIMHCKTGKEGVFIVSIPDYGYTPFGQSNQQNISARLAEYNAICESVAMAENIPFINITPISEEGLNDPSLVASDGLHPSAIQYGLWIELMKDTVKALLP